MGNKLYRSKKDFVFGGVCGGIAEYFEFDHPLLIRLTFIMLFIAPAIPSTLIYLIFWVGIKYKNN